MDAMMVAELYHHTGEFLVSWDVASPAVVAAPVFAVGWFLRDVAAGSFPLVVAFCAVAALVYVALVVVFLGFRREDRMLVASARERYALPLEPLETFVARFEK
jgi:hypothetical protein